MGFGSDRSAGGLLLSGRYVGRTSTGGTGRPDSLYGGWRQYMDGHVAFWKENEPSFHHDDGQGLCVSSSSGREKYGTSFRYSRQLSSTGEILVHGKRCKIVGRVCMDQLMIDVSDVQAKSGDIVTLIGKDGDDCITADDLASLYGTIGYEVVCGISKRVPRIYIV